MSNTSEEQASVENSYIIARFSRPPEKLSLIFAPGECTSTRSGGLIVWCEYTINSDEHSAQRYVRSGPGQPTATEQRDEPWAYCISTGQLRENKGESVSGAEWRRAQASRSAAETNSLDRYPFRQKGPGAIRILQTLRICCNGQPTKENRHGHFCA